MKPFLILFLLSPIALAALPPGVIPFPGTENVKPAEPSQIIEVALERTRCLADCPAYKVVFNTDGSFTYTGTYNVERMGQHTGQVEVGSLQQIFRYIDEIDFFSFDTLYDSPYLDSATVRTTVAEEGRRKTVQNYANSAPATLWALETLLDSLLETATWDESGGAR